eukprot:3762046-Rhodomonas_salina.1
MAGAVQVQPPHNSADDIPSPNQSFLLQNGAQAVKEELATGTGSASSITSLPALWYAVDEPAMKVAPLMRTASESAIKATPATSGKGER